MREIKFRAWFHGAGDPRVEPYMKFSHPFPVLFWQAVEEFPIAVEVMQFTGLHDKNGREIYEGDIVMVINYLNGEPWEGHMHPCAVHFIAGRFELKDHWCHESLSSSTVEIIGNIHTNPELLS